MTKHTPEPWVVSCGAIFRQGGSASIAATHGADAFDGRATNQIALHDRQCADARRIVACVNACRGLPTDELEQKGLVTAVGTRLLEADQLRDELLEELIITLGSLKEICNERGVPCPGSTIRRAEATIAKAKGGAA